MVWCIHVKLFQFSVNIMTYDRGVNDASKSCSTIGELFPMYFYVIFYLLVKITKKACPTIYYCRFPLAYVIEWDRSLEEKKF